MSERENAGHERGVSSVEPRLKDKADCECGCELFGTLGREVVVALFFISFLLSLYGLVAPGGATHDS